MKDRRDERHGLIVNGRYRTGRGLPMDIVLHDLSRSGCQIHDRMGRLEVDQFLTIRIGPIGPIDAHVRWLEGRNAGIQFDTPLNDAVLDHICTLAEPVSARSQAPPEPRAPHVERLDLNDRERRFAEAIGALDVDGTGREVLAGLDRVETEWLLGWRRKRVHERQERPTYRSDIVLAEQLEEAHELRRRNRHPF
jgi:hypothetical protein